MRKGVFVVFLALAVVVTACASTTSITSFDECVQAGFPVMESSPRQCSDGQNTFTEQLVGGDRDEHGCLGSAGYSYDEEVGGCTRGWELDSDQRRAAALAVESLDSEGLTVTEVATLRCSGCFNVMLDAGDDHYLVQLENWTSSTAGDVPVACTKEYQPVCGSVQVQCVTTPCNPVRQTFGNLCTAQAAGAFAITEGECPEPDRKEVCEEQGGTWLSKYDECEGISEEICTALGGSHDACASACRNDPEAEICTMQCVQVCKFY